MGFDLFFLDCFENFVNLRFRDTFDEEKILLDGVQNRFNLGSRMRFTIFQT